MLKIHPDDADRIMENFNRAYAYQLEHQEYKLAAATLIIAFRDMWVSAHEYKWWKRRQKLRKTIRQYNFENDVKSDLRAL